MMKTIVQIQVSVHTGCWVPVWKKSIPEKKAATNSHCSVFSWPPESRNFESCFVSRPGAVYGTSQPGISMKMASLAHLGVNRAESSGCRSRRHHIQEMSGPGKNQEVQSLFNPREGSSVAEHRTFLAKGRAPVVRLPVLAFTTGSLEVRATCFARMRGVRFPPGRVWSVEL